MDEYIKKQDLIDWCNETYQKQTKIQGKEYCNAFLQAVVMAPTADVVPKSEVENIISNQRQRLNEYKTQIVTLQEKLDQAKAEGAREAIEEIKREISKFGILPNNCAIVSIDTIAELKKKFEEKYGGSQ